MIFSNLLFNFFILIVFIIKCKCELTKEDASYEDFSVTTDNYEKEKEKEEIVKNVTDLVEFDITQGKMNSLCFVFFKLVTHHQSIHFERYTIKESEEQKITLTKLNTISYKLN